jgi:hypothetical protein
MDVIQSKKTRGVVNKQRLLCIDPTKRAPTENRRRFSTGWLSNLRHRWFHHKWFAVTNNQPALAEWSTFCHKRELVFSQSRPFSALSRRILFLPQPKGGASSPHSPSDCELGWFQKNLTSSKQPIQWNQLAF